MDFIDQSIESYALNHSSEETSLLQKIHRETYMDILNPRMLSGHLQGRILSMLSNMIRPDHILEIGTYTGYSALCLAEGLSHEGRLTTIDINEELEDRVREYFSSSEYNEKIDFRIGNALDIMLEIKTVFDLVFIDADKKNYCQYFDLIFPKLRKGGILIADNVLWNGKVITENVSSTDRDTKGILEFNKMIQKDERVENVLFPVRDGLMVIRKL